MCFIYAVDISQYGISTSVLSLLDRFKGNPFC